MCNDITFQFGHTKINPLTFPYLCALSKFSVSLFPMNEYIFVLRSRQICLRTNSYADPNSTLQCKSKQPHAPQLWVYFTSSLSKIRSSIFNLKNRSKNWFSNGYRFSPSPKRGPSRHLGSLTVANWVGVFRF